MRCITHADLASLEAVFREIAGMRGKGGSHFNQLFAGYVIYIYSCHIIKLRWEKTCFSFCEKLCSQWGYILDEEQGRRALFSTAEQTVLSAVKHKSCSQPLSSTLGIATPGRNLAGCPTKGHLRVDLEDSDKVQRSWPSASWALKPDLIAPFLNKSISWGQVTSSSLRAWTRGTIY